MIVQTMTEAKLKKLQAQLVGEIFIDPENPKLLAHDVASEDHGIVAWMADGAVRMIGGTDTPEGGIRSYMDKENNVDQKPIATCRQSKAFAAIQSGLRVQVYLIRLPQGVDAKAKAKSMRRQYKLPWNLDGQ